MKAGRRERKLREHEIYRDRIKRKEITWIYIQEKWKRRGETSESRKHKWIRGRFIKVDGEKWKDKDRENMMMDGNKVKTQDKEGSKKK